MNNVIAVKDLNREYKIAIRSDNLIKYLLFRRYERITAVKNLNFNICNGEMVGFVGPNGAGKSTTIKMLCGILVKSFGDIAVLGKDPFKKRKENMYDIGVVFGQRSQLWWDLPLSDSFLLLKKIYKVSDEEYKRQLELLEEYFSLKSTWNKPVRQLSLGQRMRGEIAAAIVHNPKILFLDEPTIGLDVVAKREIREFIKVLRKEYGTTVLLTSHDMKDIEEICDRIIIIDKGQLVIDMSMKDLKDRFIKQAVVKIDFVKPVSLNEDIKVFAISSGPNQQNWSFIINKHTISVGKLINELSHLGEIASVEITENTVDDIIYSIYKGQYGFEEKI